MHKKLLLVLIGFILPFLALELMLRSGHIFYRYMQDSNNKTYLADKADYTIMCVGESTTAMGGTYSYPSCLERNLSGRLADKRFKVVNKGIPGVDSKVLLEKFKNNLDEVRPDIVIAMMGVNENGYNILRMNTEDHSIKLIKFFRLFKKYFPSVSVPDKKQNDNISQTDIIDASPLYEQDPVMLAKADAFLNEGDLDNAEKLYRTYVQFYPGDPAGHLLLGNLFFTRMPEE